MSRASGLAGFSTSISPPSNLSVGVITATSLTVGGVTVATSRSVLLATNDSVVSNAGIEIFRAVPTSNPLNAGLVITVNPANNDGQSGLVLAKTNGNANGSFTAVLPGTLGSVVFAGADGSSLRPAAQITGVGGTPDSGISPGSLPGQLTFSTTDVGGTTPTERMRITSAGNVGIGTASPGSALQVEGLITGTAVVSSGTDTTAGRLLTTAAGPAQAFRRGNILGAVSQSGGVPTGAIIEEGSNANGNFTKYANGTVIMSMRRTESRSASGTLTTNVTLPLTLSEDVATGRGSVTATVNSATPQNATSISVNDTDSTTAIEVRILRSNATDTSFYVTLVGRWF